MVEAEDRYCEEQRIRLLDPRNELGLSMAFIRESTDFAKDDLGVFPPMNHENLYIDGFDRDRESPSESSSPSSSSRLSNSSSSSSFSPSDTDEQFEFEMKSQSQPSEIDGKSPPSVSHLRVESPPSDSVGKSRWKSLYYYSTIDINIIQRWYKLLVARVLPNFQKLVTWFSENSLCYFSRTLRSFYPVMVILIWWWMRKRARRRLQGGQVEAHLINTIKERDERIAQLLHQIAQMKELLVKKKHLN